MNTSIEVGFLKHFMADYIICSTETPEKDPEFEGIDNH